MFAKLIVLTGLMFAVAAGLLLLRQDRLGLAHEAANLHAQVQQKRQRVWEAQAVSAALLPPDKLRSRIETVGLRLEPWMVPQPVGADRVQMVRRQLHSSRRTPSP